MTEWRKNPKWSVSRCLALLLPLNELQGEIRGLTGRNVLKHQLQTGKVDMPSMSKVLKDCGAVDFALDDANSPPEERKHTNKTKNNSSDEAETLLESVSRDQFANCTVTIHEAPRKTYESVV